MAAVRSKGGEVEVDGGGALRGRRGGGRRQWRVLGMGTRRRHALGPGSRTVDGGGTTMVSRATKERERESTGLKKC
jgi:hypothetical protein